MNLRQKAKRFKKLYENTLPKKPYPVIYEACSEKHYKVCCMVDKRDIVDSPQAHQSLKTHVENGILRDLKPIIWDNLKAEEDLYTDKIIYSLDVWM